MIGFITCGHKRIANWLHLDIAIGKVKTANVTNTALWRHESSWWRATSSPVFGRFTGDIVMRLTLQASFSYMNFSSDSFYFNLIGRGTWRVQAMPRSYWSMTQLKLGDKVSWLTSFVRICCTRKPVDADLADPAVETRNLELTAKHFVLIATAAGLQKLTNSWQLITQTKSIQQAILLIYLTSHSLNSERLKVYVSAHDL